MRSPDQPRKCPNCGTEVAATDKVCWRCYRSLPPPTPPPPQPKHPRRRRRVPASVLLAIAVVLGLAGYCWHVRSSPTTCLMTYLQAQHSGDVRTAYRLLSVRSREMINPEELQAASQAPGSAPGPAPVYAIRSVEPDNGGVKITLDVTTSQASSTPPAKSVCCMYLVREGGSWKMDMVRTSREQMGDVMVGQHGWFRLWSTKLGGN